MKPVKLRAITVNINDYPGSINDLSGCLADGKQVKDTLLGFWPAFDIRRYADSQATVKTFKTSVSTAIKLLDPGATVLVLADSCFSGTITRPAIINPNNALADYHPTRNRFYAQPGMPVNPVVKTFLSKGGIRWIVISGCGETQYSADAYINGAYHGAFTWYLMSLLRPGITYRQWFEELRKYLPSSQFEQAPTLEGPEYLIDRKVFEDQTLVIHNSTHGTQLPGIAEEPIDEAICLYDGNLRDNEYNSLLQNIP